MDRRRWVAEMSRQNAKVIKYTKSFILLRDETPFDGHTNRAQSTGIVIASALAQEILSRHRQRCDVVCVRAAAISQEVEELTDVRHVRHEVRHAGLTNHAQ